MNGQPAPAGCAKPQSARANARDPPMHPTPPDWPGWPPSSPHSWPVNGHDLQLGSALGQLLAATHQQTRTLERISDRIEELPERITDVIQSAPGGRLAERESPGATKSSPPGAGIPPGLLAALTVRDVMMLAIAGGMLILVLMGKATLREVIDALIGLNPPPAPKT